MSDDTLKPVFKMPPDNEPSHYTELGFPLPEVFVTIVLRGTSPDLDALKTAAMALGDELDELMELHATHRKDTGRNDGTVLDNATYEGISICNAAGEDLDTENENDQESEKE